MMTADRSPSVSYAVITGTCFYCTRLVSTVVNTYELIPAGIEAADILVYMKYCIVVSAFAVFGLVIYTATFNFNLSDREVPLEVRSIILRVPETELYITVQIELFSFRGAVHQGKSGEFAVFVKRYEYLLNCIETVLRAFEYGISETVSAFVGIKRNFYRLPARVPYAVSILYIVVMSAAVHRTVVITVAGEPHQLRILIKAIASRCI